MNNRAKVKGRWLTLRWNRNLSAWQSEHAGRERFPEHVGLRGIGSTVKHGQQRWSNIYSTVASVENVLHLGA